jgi:carbamoyltransferase
VIVLGLSYDVPGHDSAAALVCDGVLIAAAEEERFSRRKHESGVPIQSISFCLSRAGLRMADVDVLAFAHLPYRSGPNSYLGFQSAALTERLHKEHGFYRRFVWHKRVLDLSLKLGIRVDLSMERAFAAGLSEIQRTFGKLPNLAFFDHHLAHAAATYLTSDRERATILSVDGGGGFCSAGIWRGEGETVTRLHEEPAGNSMGVFYEDCTLYLGLERFSEGKTMGLAPYGDPNTYARSFAPLLRKFGRFGYRYTSPPSESIFGFPPRRSEPILQQKYMDFAAAAQCRLAKAVRRFARMGIEKTSVSALCLSGGVALNCSSNGSLLKSLPASVWVFPAAGDSGLSVGAARLAAARSRELRRTPLQTAYLGPEFDERACLSALEKTRGLSYRLARPVSSEAARILANGEVIGWFQGRMEFGPRALGNRSILADPRSEATRDRVNRVKSRELWRPLSPAVLAERAYEFFDIDVPTPFMLLAVPVRPEKRSVIPAVVHVDGSARPQTVTRDQNATFYDLIAEFGRLTGVPVLLNTSFNNAGEPIVCTPEDAIRTFLANDLDVLVLGNYIVRRETEMSRLGLPSSE